MLVSDYEAVEHVNAVLTLPSKPWQACENGCCSTLRPLLSYGQLVLVHPLLLSPLYVHVPRVSAD